VLKGSYKLDYSFNATEDLDIFVLPCDTSVFFRICSDLNFIYLENVPVLRENYTRDLYYFDADSNRRYHLHVHTQLNFGSSITPGFNLNFENLLITQRRLDIVYNLFILPPELELLLLAARKKYQNGKRWMLNTETYDYLKLLRKVHNENHSNIEYIKENFSYSTFAYVNKVLNHGDLNVGFEFKLSKIKTLPTYIYVARVFLKIWKFLFGSSLSGSRRIPFKGKSIVLVGIDGCGKSSSIETLMSFFNEFMDVEKVTLGSGRSGASWIRRIIFFFFGSKAFLKGHKGTRNFENEARKEISMIYAFWVWLCLLDKSKNLKKLNLALLKGKLVLVDRWIQSIDLNFADAPRFNLYTSSKGFLGFVARYEEEIFKRAADIIPSEVILLNISPENSLLRKPHDLTMNQAKRNADNMMNFKWTKISKLTVVDANSSHENVVKSITTIIFNNLKK